MTAPQSDPSQFCPNTYGLQRVAVPNEKRCFKNPLLEGVLLTWCFLRRSFAGLVPLPECALLGGSFDFVSTPHTLQPLYKLDKPPIISLLAKALNEHPSNVRTLLQTLPILEDMTLKRIGSFSPSLLKISSKPSLHESQNPFKGAPTTPFQGARSFGPVLKDR